MFLNWGEVVGGGGCWNSMGKVLSEEVSRFVISKEKLFLLFLLKRAFFLSLSPTFYPLVGKEVVFENLVLHLQK